MKRPPKKRRYVPEVVKGLGKDLQKWIEVPTNFWLGEFAVQHKMDRHRLVEIAKEDKEFGKIYKMAKQVQENKIVKMGFSKNFNQAFAIFTLKNVAGWRDMTETKHEGNIILTHEQIETLLHRRSAKNRSSG